MTGRQNVQKTHQEYVLHLRQLYQLLKRSAVTFDNGEYVEAIILAALIHSLVHDGGKKNPSALTLLGRKNVNFINTATPMNSDDMMTKQSLVMMRMGNEDLSYLPILDQGSPPHYQQPPQRFDAWWNAPVLLDTNRSTLSRKNVVFAMRNQGGGGHVSRNWDEVWAGYVRGTASGWTFMRGGVPIPIEFGPEYSTVRQIAYELERTIIENCGDILAIQDTH